MIEIFALVLPSPGSPLPAARQAPEQPGHGLTHSPRGDWRRYDNGIIEIISLSRFVLFGGLTARVTNQNGLAFVRWIRFASSPSLVMAGHSGSKNGVARR